MTTQIEQQEQERQRQQEQERLKMTSVEIERQYNERLQEAQRIAREKDITTSEALRSLGSPVPDWRIEQEVRAKEAATRAQEEANRQRASERGDQYYETVEQWKQAGSPAAGTGQEVKIGGKPPPGVEYSKPDTTVLKVGVRTDSPETIKRTAEIERLRQANPQLYKVLVNEGIENYERAISAQRFIAQQEGKRTGAQIREFEVKLKDAPATIRTAYEQGGIEAYNKAVDDYNRQIEQTHVKLPDGSYVADADFKKMPAKYTDIGLTKGYDAMVKAIDSDIAQSDKALKQLDNYKDAEGNYYLGKFMADSKAAGGLVKSEKVKILKEAGFSSEAIEEAGKPELSAVKAYWQWATPWDEAAGERASLKGVSIMAAEQLVPGVMVVGRWGELTPTERATYIAIDALSVLPVAGAAVRGARVGASFGARAMAAGVAKEVGKEVVAQAVAPVNMIIHPIGTVKATGKQILNLAENIASPGKVPYAVVTTTDGVVRIRVTKDMTKAEAMAARDLIMAEYAKGKQILVQAGDYVIEPVQSPFMREARKAGGTVAHATPDIEPFEKILTSEAKAGKPLNEAGIFFANEPPVKFSQQSAFGKTGERPGIYIASKETASKMVSSNKIYRNTAELESVLPPGAKTSGPQQRLYTRIGPNADKVEILLEKPLTARQLARLKAETLIEAVKAPFKPAIKIKATGRRAMGLTAKETQALARELRAAGNADQAANLLRAHRALRGTRAVPRSLAAITGRVSPREVRAARTRLEAAGMRVARLERPERITRPERLTRAERIERAERLSRAERGERLTRAERAERAERIARGERVERPERAERLTRAERLERAERVDRPERAERITRPDRADRITRPERVDRTDRLDRLDKLDRGRLRLPGRATDQEKRELIKKHPGATTLNMGKLHGKDVWHTWLDNGQRLVVLGAQPEGTVIQADGAGSAYKTTQRIGTRGFDPIKAEFGFMGAAIRP
ncbi:MAG: hypothetical protein Q8O55_02335, partial [Dehalococcoidales bacterium]|nr:hypothetical protein [Dehalococcoidales bacterium]